MMLYDVWEEQRPAWDIQLCISLSTRKTLQSLADANGVVLYTSGRLSLTTKLKHLVKWMNKIRKTMRLLNFSPISFMIQIWTRLKKVRLQMKFI